MSIPPQIECLSSIFPKEICFYICKYAAPNIKNKKVKYELYRRPYCEQLLIAHEDEPFITPRGEWMVEYPPKCGQHITETSPNVQWNRARCMYIKSKHRGNQNLQQTGEIAPHIFNFNVISESLFCEWEENVPNSNKKEWYINKKYLHWVLTIHTSPFPPEYYEKFREDYTALGASPWHYGIKKALIMNKIYNQNRHEDHEAKVSALMQL